MTHAFWKRLALAAFILADGGVAASAATDVCSDLQARLDALSRSGSGNGDAYRMYDAQATQQRAALDRATSQARSAGCYGGIFSPKASPQCPQLITSINTMATTLAHLTDTRDQYRSDPYALTSQRNDILRLMSINRCGNYAAYTPPSNGGFLASLFGGGLFGNGYSGGYGYGYGATYRTLCVRASDGYYFPISFSTTPDHFNTDAAACQAMCPGANVSLYVHHNPGEEVDSMVSLTGLPYSALPTAFKYRTSYDPSSSCGSATQSPVDQLAAQTAALTPGGQGQTQPVFPINVPGANAIFTPLPLPTPLVPIPALRPASASEDPETLADRGGQLIPAPVVIDSGPVVAGVTSDGRPIRLVGPSYYVAR
jgi:hypothetical protein